MICVVRKRQSAGKNFLGAPPRFRARGWRAAAAPEQQQRQQKTCKRGVLLRHHVHRARKRRQNPKKEGLESSGARACGGKKQTATVRLHGDSARGRNNKGKPGVEKSARIGCPLEVAGSSDFPTWTASHFLHSEYNRHSCSNMSVCFPPGVLSATRRNQAKAQTSQP